MGFSILLQESKILTRYRNQANTEWKTDSFFFSSNKYLVDNLKRLRICQNCLELYGEIWLEDGQLVFQECQKGCCHSTQREERWHVNNLKTGRKYYHDFNKEYEICQCCGLEVIPSGSRWSSFFCRPCKEMILQFNQKAGKCVVPIGRHSMMNGIFLSYQDIKNEGAIKDFVSGVNQTFSSMDIVHQNGATVTRNRIQQLRLGSDPTAIKLLLKTEHIDRNQVKKEAVIELIANVIKKTPDEVKRVTQDIFT